MSVEEIKIDQLADKVMQGLNDYHKILNGDLKKIVRRAANTVRNDIKANAPRRTGKYAESWTVKKTGESANKIYLTVCSPSRYMLAHPLEHGHKTRDDGMTRAFPHIKPAEEHGIKQLENEIEKIIQKG